MTENQFDEFFRRKLGDHSSKVPEDMWQRIKQKKDKDRTVIILLLLLLLVLGGGTTYFIVSEKESTNGNIASVQKQGNKDARNNTALKQNEKPDSTNHQSESLGNSGQGSLVPGEGLATNEVRTIKDNDTKGRAVHNGKSGPGERDQNGLYSKNDAVNEQGKMSQRMADSLQTDISNEIPMPAQAAPVTTGDQKTTAHQNDSAKEMKNKIVVAKTRKDRSPIINNVFLEAFASPDFPVSRTSGNAAYLQHKDSTSKMQLSYTFGLRVGALIGQHFTLKTGLQYSVVNEKFNYTEKNATRTVPVVIERTLPDANGIERTVLDTSTFTEVGSAYQLNYNHYKSIDMPVLIGYQTTGERFNAAFNTGVILNIKTSYKGAILDSSLNAVDINSNNFYKNNTGVSLYFGLGLSTRLNNNFHLFTEPYIRYRLSNMTGTHQQFTQKINVGGLSLGLRYNF